MDSTTITQFSEIPEIVASGIKRAAGSDWSLPLLVRDVPYAQNTSGPRPMQLVVV